MSYELLITIAGVSWAVSQISLYIYSKNVDAELNKLHRRLAERD